MGKQFRPPKVATKPMKLASFDIFDTTLIRKCGKPENIFFLVAQKLFPNDKALREEFLLWRQSAETKARQRIGGKEPSLDDIYANKPGKEIEMQIEADNLIANPEVKSLIETKRQEGYTICFISDMYLSSNFLSDILRRENCLLADEKVFVSCEANARKSSGKLYDAVRKALPKISQWTHYGDYALSDVKIPRKKGIKATKVNTPFTDTEQLILNRSKSLESEYEMSILAGLQRAARLSHQNSDYAEIAADFVSPAYIPYVSFLLADARARGLQRLYFLSRDSHILMKLAEVQKENYPDIEFRYLFISRKSLLLPFLKNANVESYLSTMDHHTIMRRKVDDLLEPLNTSREELASIYGISFDYSKIHGNKEEKDFLEKLFGGNSSFLPELKKRITSQRSLLLDYFRQSGLMDGKKCGMVDVGWLGTSRLMINEILQSEGFSPTEFYYFGIRKDTYPSTFGRYTSYFRPSQLSTELTTLVENYFSASPYPSTLGYVKNEDHVVPLFASEKGYQDTTITSANREISQWIWREMKSIGLNFEPAFWDWAKISLDAITSLSVKINLQAFARCAEFDGIPFVKKLSFAELFSIIILGDHVTAFDKASVQWTCGRTLYPTLWQLHSLSGRIRRKLYLKVINNGNE